MYCVRPFFVFLSLFMFVLCFFTYCFLCAFVLVCSVCLFFLYVVMYCFIYFFCFCLCVSFFISLFLSEFGLLIHRKMFDSSSAIYRPGKETQPDGWPCRGSWWWWGSIETKNVQVRHPLAHFFDSRKRGVEGKNVESAPKNLNKLKTKEMNG